MPHYTPPLRDMQFVLHELLDVENALRKLDGHADIDRATIDAVLEEGGKFCAEVVFPLNQSGDREGCTHHPDGSVSTPKGFKEAYEAFVAAGWPALGADPAWGGQGLPHVVHNAMLEMLNSANQAWSMYPGLTHGAYNALMAFGTDAQKKTYLPKLVSGEWTGTMCLTEAQAGTDLGLIRTRAQPAGDGSFAITGSKIFISAGEHDLSANIIHLVLARLPDAPAGTKGISLFVVPKFVPDANGEVGPRNAVTCGAIEHKMGIHGNATCVINFDAAKGWLVGEPNRGLNAMFVMMNTARLGVGMQSVGLAEVAYQNSLAYAKQRLQSRSLTGPKAPDQPADPIIFHPDVRRMLLTQKAYVEAARAFTYWAGLAIDREHKHPSEKVRADSADLVALLTPVIKGFITDNGYECTTLAMQVLGGHGYIAESGLEQYVRDARINMIYEGTNTVQALDLLGRKVLADGGAKLMKFGKVIAELLEEHAGNQAMQEFTAPLEALGREVQKLTMEIGGKAMANPDEMGAAAVPYLRVIGHLVFSFSWCHAAAVALRKQGSGDPFYQSKLMTARFYFAKLYPESRAMIDQARSGATALMEMDAALF
ncbi:MAG: acyl-CoA dehydrogenase C-terminal domain-containing protein [Proteobacteria bacterium]|nr:acyl-CoA dehydrogenase C-terminal domain-containing protein [Pseudomonadota bacterium]MBS0463080.1 acyl-CoA dehydrogenase C-terminal domain-containing protein [Pseudomonadota bacterium]MBS0463791.1 acyl-CoA dehydrogenase C-terminal domain-containing protein [Pseudomonadota bacterium]